MNPADELRAAATLLREKGAPASELRPGPWHTKQRGVTWDIRSEQGLVGGTPHWAEKRLAEWIALMSAEAAEPLADWLEHVAGDLTTAALAVTKWPDGETQDPADYIDEPDSARLALVFARAITGSTS
ncbi:hypothetical protein ACIBI3_02195 [Actinomadura luteofluorescens]|uniref:hypothetical protein n=1 Tax=Actinomadura luteofluorescens TaxID=46163 RepID=UPI00346F1DBE